MSDMNTAPHLLTAEDVLASEYESGELWDGVFVVCEPSGGWAGAVEGRLAAQLAQSNEWRAGWSFGASQGYVVTRNPDRVLAPDLSFVSRSRLPTLPERGFIEGPPEFAVEVRSPSESWIATVEKGGIWIGHGVRVVWCVDPGTHRIVVMRAGEEPKEQRPGGKASAQPVLDIQLDVAALFEGLGRA